MAILHPRLHSRYFGSVTASISPNSSIIDKRRLGKIIIIAYILHNLLNTIIFYKLHPHLIVIPLEFIVIHQCREETISRLITHTRCKKTRSIIFCKIGTCSLVTECPIEIPQRAQHNLTFRRCYILFPQISTFRVSQFLIHNKFIREHKTCSSLHIKNITQRCITIDQRIETVEIGLNIIETHCSRSFIKFRQIGFFNVYRQAVIG